MAPKSAAQKKGRENKRQFKTPKKYATLEVQKKRTGSREKVIKLAEKEYIKHLWEEEGKSLREIAKICKLNFRTVQKYATQDDFNEPEQKLRMKKERYPVLGGYIEIIDEWLKNDELQPRKQRHTIKKVHNRLVEEKGFPGSYSSVKKYIRKKKAKEKVKKEASLPLKHEKSHAQIDFGSFKYYDALEKSCEGFYLALSFLYSNSGYIQVFKSQNQECLLEGLKQIFYHIGGVPKMITADNMTTAVSKILPQGQRELTEGFRRFMLHYRFSSHFCNVASGNEKGNVENKVGYTRRNFLVPIPTITNFTHFNKELLSICDQDLEREHYLRKTTIKELWEEEKQELLSLPANEYIVFRYESARIDNSGFVKVDTNRYGVSPELCNQMAHLKIYYDKVEIYHERALIKTYERTYGQNDEVSDWTQYLNLLCKKPGGLEHMRYYNQIPKLWREHLSQTKGNERKSALTLLKEIVQQDKLELGSQALELAKLYGRSDTQSIRQCYFSLSNNEHNPEPINFSFKTPLSNYNPNLKVYDSLMEREAYKH